MLTHLKNELHNIISGKSQIRYGATIQAIASYLNDGARPNSKTENTKQIREQETKKLENFITQESLWINTIDFSQYVSEGAEQRVFLKDSNHVLKLNDAIYYRTWVDYFYNLLLHNFFFTDTAYKLIGFTKENDTLFAVVQQSYVEMTHITELNEVRNFLASNGFKNTKNNDYFNPELGIILEDLHDENVLTRNSVLYFIDTVFFTTENFWNDI
jgi:secreted protein with Ig-like and vWFA domain